MTTAIEECIKALEDSFSEQNITREMIEDIIYIPEEDEIESLPTGRRLYLIYISFSGRKADGTDFHFQHSFASGINLFLADNFKGKSTIFAVIKTVLTGKFDSLDKSVRNWVSDIQLSINLSGKPFSIALHDPSGRKFSAEVYQSEYDKIKPDQIPFFSAATKKEYSDWIQELFFDEFCYYSLYWTSKVSAKNKEGLQTNKTSWHTYYKSMHLQSKDYSTLFGNQENKIAEMLLGLDYTAIINTLTIRMELLQAKSASALLNTDTSYNEQMTSLPEEIRTLQDRLQRIREECEEQTLSELRQKQASINALHRQHVEAIQDLTNKINKLEIEIESQASETDRIKQKINDNRAEMRSLTRRLNTLRVAKDGHHFFAGLTITVCPSCNAAIDFSSHHDGKDSCPLCHHDIVANPNLDEWNDRITETEMSIKLIDEALSSLGEKLTSSEEKSTRLNNILSGYIAEREKLTDACSSLNLSKIDKEINELIYRNSEKQQIKESISTQLAVATYRYEQLKNTRVNNSEDDAIRIEVLKHAIRYFINRRCRESIDVFEFMRSGMINLLHNLGMNTVSDIIFDDKLEITYIKDNIDMKFDDFAEGEQLRLKIAFYLTVIQLTQSNNVGGRHSQLLIIDSPSKEEADNGYVTALKEALEYIQVHYADSVQIIVGTAERGFESLNCHRLIVEPGAFLF